MQHIKTALLSFGLSGKVFHAPFLDAHPGFELYAIWERTKNEAGLIYPNSKIVRNYEAILNDDNIDLVVVNTPTHTHYDYALQALHAGKSVIVEKAFTTTVAEAMELKTVAETNKLLIAVYQNRRWDSDFMTVKKIIDEQWVGDIQDVSFQFDRFKLTVGNKAHKEVPGPGAGLLNDLGPHLIDQALYLFGMPEKIFADIRMMRRESLVDDYFDVLCYYPSFRVRLKSSLLVKEPLPAFIVHGTAGSFLKTRADIQEAALMAGKKPGTTNWGMEPDTEMGWLHTTLHGEEIKKRIPTLPGNYGIYYDKIYESFTQHQPAPVTAEDGIRVMQLLEAARKSNALGTVVPVS